MKNVTAIVISFLRPEYTVACIKSLRAMYPDIQIIVGENGYANEWVDAACTLTGALYVKLPFDSGVCFARNELMKHVQTKYVLVGDDDFYYDEDARVCDMHTLLEANESTDLVGGRVRQNGKVGNYQGYIERSARSITVTPFDVENGEYQFDDASKLRYAPVDLTFNYFVARADNVRQIPWDDKIKVAYEHLSWFVDAKEAGLNVVFSPDPIVIHKPEFVQLTNNDIERYSHYRLRRTDKERFFTRFNIDYMTDMRGNKDYSPFHALHRAKNDTKFVDFCITTFERPEALARLLRSITRYYPMANIYVADQSKEFDRQWYTNLRNELMEIGLQKRPCFEHLEYDCGVSAARNHLVNTTPNKYKLILDDDFEFTERTDIGKMVKLLETFPGAGIVGGMVEQLGSELHFEFTPEIRGDTLRHVTEKPAWKNLEGIAYRKTGCVLNFALMRKEMFRHIQWDNNLKVTEHIDFYLRMKAVPYYILYTPNVVVDHPPIKRSTVYTEKRTRDEFMVMMYRKHRIKRVQYENGQVYELTDDGAFKKYRIAS